jgi:hypothetical protein
MRIALDPGDLTIFGANLYRTSNRAHKTQTVYFFFHYLPPFLYKIGIKPKQTGMMPISGAALF